MPSPTSFGPGTKGPVATVVPPAEPVLAEPPPAAVPPAPAAVLPVEPVPLAEPPATTSDEPEPEPAFALDAPESDFLVTSSTTKTTTAAAAASPTMSVAGEPFALGGG